MSSEKDIDQILRELDQIDIVKEKSGGKSLFGKTKSKLNIFQLFWAQVVVSALVVWNRFLSPIWGVLYWVGFGLLFKTYRKIWNRFAFESEGEERIFSKKKGAITLVATFFVGYFMISILSFVWHTALYFATARVDEVVYLSNAQEIGPKENVFSVQGCEIEGTGEEFSCSAEESLYFRIDPTAFSQVWSILDSGSIFYPDYVAASIAPGWARCTITSYGFRIKTMIRSFEIYPELLAARCESSQ